MATGITALVSWQTHRRIDHLTFPGLLTTAAWMARWDRRAAAITLATACVEGVAYLTTDYPPAILPLMSFRTHNRVATAHGALVIGLGLTLPGLTRRGRWALCALGTMPITLAALSDTREPQPAGEVSELRERAASSSSYRRWARWRVRSESGQRLTAPRAGRLSESRPLAWQPTSGEDCTLG